MERWESLDSRNFAQMAHVRSTRSASSRDDSQRMSQTFEQFHVALTADFYTASGEPKFADLGLACSTPHPQIKLRPFAEHRPQIGADQLGRAPTA